MEKNAEKLSLTDYESVGREFESLQARQKIKGLGHRGLTPFSFGIKLQAHCKHPSPLLTRG